MKQFVINQYSTLPYLDIELINDGRHDFRKFYLAIQGAEVTFSMTNKANGVKSVANGKCFVLPCENVGCEDKFKIRYKWNKRDTSRSGRFIGQFKIKFSDNIHYGDMVFPSGELIVPIAEELEILINDGSVKI